jgi:glucose-1-phosphate adenylyltransferase
LTEDIPEFNLYERKQRIYTHARMLPTTKIEGSKLDKAVIADGCLIHAQRIERSVIGIRSRIGAESVVMNTYMMGSDFYESLDDIELNKIEILMGIGERCYINNTIIDKNCRIGDDVRIDGGKHLADKETEMYAIKEGIVVLKKGAIIPSGYVI